MEKVCTNPDCDSKPINARKNQVTCQVCGGGLENAPSSTKNRHGKRTHRNGPPTNSQRHHSGTRR
jgi:hypothetical protein